MPAKNSLDYVCNWIAPGSNIPCCKSFQFKYNLTTHYRIHTGQNPFACSYPKCSQAFKSKGNCMDHEKRHVKERPYPCPIEECQRAFYRRYQLVDRHRQSCHPEYSKEQMIVMLNGERRSHKREEFMSTEALRRNEKFHQMIDEFDIVQTPVTEIVETNSIPKNGLPIKALLKLWVDYCSKPE